MSESGFVTTLVPIDKIKPPMFQCRGASLDENLDELVILHWQAPWFSAVWFGLSIFYAYTAMKSQFDENVRRGQE